jgi:hypothetical protein
MIKLKYKNQQHNNSAIGALVAIGILLLLIGAILFPLATIWALNTLFNLTIAFNFWNWLAMAILIITFQVALNISRKR